MTAPFNIDEHRTDRIRHLEQRVNALTRYREHQERVLALAVLCLAEVTGQSTDSLLHALDEIDRAAS